MNKKKIEEKEIEITKYRTKNFEQTADINKLTTDIKLLEQQVNESNTRISEFSKLIEILKNEKSHAENTIRSQEKKNGKISK